MKAFHSSFNWLYIMHQCRLIQITLFNVFNQFWQGLRGWTYSGPKLRRPYPSLFKIQFGLQPGGLFHSATKTQ